MSVNVEINDTGIKTIAEVSKELEDYNFRLLRDLSKQSYLKDDFKSWISNELEPNDDDNKFQNKKVKINNRAREKNQFRCFQSAMKVLYAFGRCIGLNPVSSIFAKDISRIRFKFISWPFLYTTFTATAHSILVFGTFYVLFGSPMTIRSLTVTCFYFVNWCITIISLRIATKWNNLVKEISNCALDEYVDWKVIKRINIFCIVVIVCAFLQYLFSILTRIAQIIECTNENELFEGMAKHTYPWIFGLGISYSILLGIMLQFINILVLLKWNYCDLFVACMCVYLTSILNLINEKIVWAANNNYNLPASIWIKLREDYTRATRLVRLFDDVISGLTLVSFASNLFFICLQLYNFLTTGMRYRNVLSDKCSQCSSPVWGYEYSIYLVYYSGYLMTRFLTVALVASNVNVASAVPAPALYTLPPTAYTKEVQRFLDQLHGDVVALTGLDFFHITRSIILSAAATIVTYELVLLQFHSDEINET